jgi:hypothetical protein
MWFQHDGAPPHFSHEMRQRLSANCLGSYIGRCRVAPVYWPARSPDLNSLHYFSLSLWEYLKANVTASTGQERWRRIKKFSSEIKNAL